LHEPRVTTTVELTTSLNVSVWTSAALTISPGVKSMFEFGLIGAGTTPKSIQDGGELVPIVGFNVYNSSWIEIPFVWTRLETVEVKLEFRL